MRKRMARRVLILIGSVALMLGANVQASFACCCVPHDLCDITGC